MRSRGILWVLIGLVAVVVTARIADHYAARAAEAAERDRLRGQTALLAQWVAALGERIDAQQTAVDAAQAILSRVTLIDSNGIVIGDSSQNRDELAGMDNHGGRPEVAAARSGVTGESRRRSATTKVYYLYSARRVEGPGPVRYVRVAVRAPTSSTFRLSNITWIAGTLALGVSLLLYGYSRHRRVSLAADRIALGLESDPPSLPETAGCPEIEHLTRSIRLASDRQDRRRREVDNARKVLAAAVQGLREGLLFVDAGRRVRLANRAARRLLEQDVDPVGGTLSQAVRHPPLLDAVEQVLGDDSDEAIHLSYEDTDRAFEIRVTPLVDPDDGDTRQALVLIFDVTRLRSLERVRRSFVADISHELRTPLTAIKAAVETILEDERFRDEPFPQMISRNADALEGLIEDLTDLTLIESGAVTLDISRFDVARLVRQTTEQLRPVAGDTPIDLRLDEPLWMHGDERRVRRVLVNLLENAIKFIRPGGRIEVSGSLDGERVRLAIRDEGIGIPAANLDKIFHRFHQVAGDRSRQRPGHGLGLAIVKHLVRLHDGRIGVESELGQGSTFTLDLPAKHADDA